MQRLTVINPKSDSFIFYEQASLAVARLKLEDLDLYFLTDNLDGTKLIEQITISAH